LFEIDYSFAVNAVISPGLGLEDPSVIFKTVPDDIKIKLYVKAQSRED
jgi:hypothetical protein